MVKVVSVNFKKYNFYKKDYFVENGFAMLRHYYFDVFSLKR